MGGTSGSPLGREEGSRGTFMEWFPGRAFAFFRRAAKEGCSRRSETSLVQTPVPAAAENPRPCVPPPQRKALVPRPPSLRSQCAHWLW